MHNTHAQHTMNMTYQVLAIARGLETQAEELEALARDTKGELATLGLAWLDLAWLGLT